MLKIPFMRLGVWQHPAYGELKIDQPMMDQMKQNFKAGMPGSPPYVRLGHDKDAAEAKATFGDTPSLAWVKDLAQEGPIMYALAEPTDPKVVDWVKSKQYRFASAEFEMNHMNRETGQRIGPVLSAIGLTNEPFLTRLPEAVVLAAPVDQFYLDYEEGKRTMKFAELIKKLAAGLGINDVEDLPSDAIGLSDADKAKLAEIDQLKAKLAAQDEEQKKLAAQAVEDKKARREAEVNQLAATLVAEGIPPAQIEAVRPLLLADTGAVVDKVKLAAGGEQDATQSDLIVQSLRALPEAQRVKFGQTGAQDDKAGDRQAQVKAAVDADVVALGGTITTDGKYKL